MKHPLCIEPTSWGQGSSPFVQTELRNLFKLVSSIGISLKPFPIIFYGLYILYTVDPPERQIRILFVCHRQGPK